jgi:predicted outer membrane protein
MIMHRNLLHFTAAALVVALAALDGYSQQRRGPANGTTAQAFVQDAAKAYENEIELARLATTNGGPKLRLFAKEIADNHTKALNSLKTYAAGKNMPVSATARSSSANADSQTNQNRGNSSPSSEPAISLSTFGNHDGTPRVAELRSKPVGTDFDKAYLQMVAEDHHRRIALLEQHAGTKAGDGELRSWIGVQLPILRRHLAKAQDLQKGMILSDAPNRTPTP